MEIITSVIVVLLFVMIALAPALIVVWRTRTVLGDVLIISKRRLLVVFALMMPVSLLSSILVFIGPLIFLVILSVGFALILKPKRINSGDLQSDSHAVLKNLKRIQDDIEITSLHLKNLSSTVQASQIEIEGKEKISVALQNEIEKQSRDVEAWRELSENQKELFVQTAKEAMRRKSFIEMATIVGGGLALNIAASLVWALMGSPGKDQLFEFFDRIVR